MDDMDERLRIVLPAADGLPRITRELADEVTGLLAGTTARYVTIEGEPGAFCEGIDLDLLAGSALDLDVCQVRYAALLRAIELAPCPVIALVDGVALGGGLGLAAAADLVIATPQSTFGLPEVLLGLIPAMALPYVAQRMGVARARLLALEGATLSAAAAAQAGLVDEIADNLEAALAVHAKRFLRMDPRAMGEVKALAAELVTSRAIVDPRTRDDDARRRFALLHATPATRARIARMQAGEPPWIVEEVS
jgi:polyketide biosynthesis enoyl-CoA hydratase PksH